MRDSVYRRLNELGFAYAAVDLKGYRTGSMNETLAWPASREPEA